MIYAMNLYDLIPGKEDSYREYMLKTAEIIADLDAEPVASGHKPIKTMTGEPRSHFVIIKFANLQVFETMIERQNAKAINLLREEATENYIWTLYEDWDIASWLFPDQA